MVAVAAGWLWDLATLGTIYAGTVDMKFDIALALLGLGAALALAPTVDVGGRRRRLAMGLSLVVAGFGVVTLALDFHSRPAPITPLNFVLLGLAMALDRPPARWPQAVILFVGIDSLLGLLGYVYEVPDVEQLAPLPTIILFIALSCGALAVRPDVGVMAVITSPTSGGVLARRLLPMVIVAPVAGDAIASIGLSEGFYGPVERGVVHSFLVVTFLIFFLLGTARLLMKADDARRLAQANLQESEHKYRKLFEHQNDAITVFDQQTMKFEDVNQRATELFGYSRQDFMGLTPMDLTPQPKLSAHVLNSLRSLPSVPLATRRQRLLRRDGSTFTAEIVFGTFTSGGRRKVIAATHDVTERARAEEALRKERDFIRLAIGSLPGIFYVVTADNKFALWNRTFEVVTGRSASEIASMHPLDVIAPEDRVRVGDAIRTVFGEGRATVEASILSICGKVIPYYLTGQRIAFGDGVKLVGMGIDISERRRVEAALVRSNSDLEAFAYVASHDLREPLRTVSSYLQLLKRGYAGRLDPDADEFIGFAVDGARRMDQLIKDLLAYSRVGTHGRPLEATSLDQAIDAALANLETAIAECGAAVTHDPLPSVDGDEAQLLSLFQNLIGNAIKYRRADVAPVIHVGARREGRGWTFAVRDNGIGLEPRFYDRIFVIFQRLHGRSTYDGTGIGLAVCKKIVERHGGRIWVESVPGEGSTFSFWLPAVAD